MTLKPGFKIIRYILFTVLLPVLSLLSGDKTENKNTFSARNELIAAAQKFIESFDKENLSSIQFDFNDDERRDWDYVPRTRAGIPLRRLNTEQYSSFRKLLDASLSRKGVDKAEGVILLESVLYELSGNSSYRDPGLYYISIFGRPDSIKPWGWRFEGHHLSLNFTFIKDSTIVSTPLFLGANPAEVKEGKHKGLRVLKPEEELARELVKSFDSQQLKKAVFDEDAPGEIITENEERVDPLNPKGINGSELNKKQQEILINLLKEYISNSNPELAEQKYSGIIKDIKDIYFAWAGGFERGEEHYYRIQSSTFLIEYDNTQNNADHIHSVWRSFQNDFGNDLLKKHYKEYH
jgi:hypothetical protein